MSLDDIARAADGLLYSSESDRPFEPVTLGPAPDGELTAARFGEIVGAPAGARVEERSLDDFLARHIETSDPHDPRAQAVRPRYERLRAVLRTELRDVRVFRLGRIEVRCWVVGRDGEGRLRGLATTAIET